MRADVELAREAAQRGIDAYLAGRPASFPSLGTWLPGLYDELATAQFRLGHTKEAAQAEARAIDEAPRAGGRWIGATSELEKRLRRYVDVLVAAASHSLSP